LLINLKKTIFFLLLILSFTNTNCSHSKQDKLENEDRGGDISPVPQYDNESDNHELVNSSKKIPIEEDDPVKGESDADITIVEFMDYQCPYCRLTVLSIDNLFQHPIYGKRIRLVIKHFPLNRHQYSKRAAEFACCAHEQERFWPMHQAILTNQHSLTNKNLFQYAEHLSLNTQQLSDCLDQSYCKEKVKKDKDLGQRLGVRGTPSFFINGYYSPNGISVATIERILNQNQDF